MDFIVRFFDRFFHADTTLEQGSFEGDGCSGSQQFSHVSELENTVESQKRQIARARSLLQSAAFLAGYHQPSLARDIRALLSEIEAPHPKENGAEFSRPSPPRWPLDGPAERRLSA
ncbi:MAG TPA: hypothetical protein VFG50_13885 [Rhodothermales bacterium]|nr:hypothetical protein [Rhodothermales bacterium]